MDRPRQVEQGEEGNGDKARWVEPHVVLHKLHGTQGTPSESGGSWYLVNINSGSIKCSTASIRQTQVLFYIPIESNKVKVNWWGHGRCTSTQHISLMSPHSLCHANCKMVSVYSAIAGSICHNYCLPKLVPMAFKT